MCAMGNSHTNTHTRAHGNTTWMYEFKSPLLGDAINARQVVQVRDKLVLFTILKCFWFFISFLANTSYYFDKGQKLMKQKSMEKVFLTLWIFKYIRIFQMLDEQIHKIQGWKSCDFVCKTLDFQCCSVILFIFERPPEIH